MKDINLATLNVLAEDLKQKLPYTHHLWTPQECVKYQTGFVLGIEELRHAICLQVLRERHDAEGNK